jgi:hypothetical protein
MAKILERFTIARAADDFVLTIEDESGDIIELTASYDQLDLISEELESALDEDEDLALTDDSDDAEKDEAVAEE